MNLQENIQRILEIIKEDQTSIAGSTGGWAITYKNPMALIQNPPDDWDGLNGDVNGKLKFKDMKYGVRAGVKNLKNTYLVLYYNDKESVNRIPVLELNRVVSNSATAAFSFDITPFAGQQIIWAKSYIQTPVAYSSISASNFSVCFGVYYA